MQRPDTILICDICYIRQNKSSLDDPNIITVGSWHIRDDKDICPQCSSVLDTAMNLGLVEGEKFYKATDEKSQ